MGPVPSSTATRRRPALWGSLLLCALVLVCGPAAAQSPPPESDTAAAESKPAPRLVVENKEIDLGQLVRGESAEASFVLRNDGDAVLRILRAKPG